MLSNSIFSSRLLIPSYRRIPCITTRVKSAKQGGLLMGFLRIGKAYAERGRTRYRAVEESQQGNYQIDNEKAKKALSDLDQQLQTLSVKQTSTPKIKASDVELSSEDDVRGGTEEFSDSTLVYAVSFLLILTIFSNVLFYTVIKPSIDGPEPSPNFDVIMPYENDTNP